MPGWSKFCSRIARFVLGQAGAVTVDFVVLTAAVSLLGITVVSTFAGSTTNLANEIDNFVAEVPNEVGLN